MSALRGLFFIFISCVCASSLHAKRILVTACNEAYFESCLTLIASVHRTSFEEVDEIVVFNLGLPPYCSEVFEALQKVRVQRLEEVKEHFSNVDLEFFYRNPHQFGWKQVCIRGASAQSGDAILWLDAGVMALKNLKEIFEWIEQEDIFLVEDPYQLNVTWTHPSCASIMQATEEELLSHQVCGGIQGFKRSGKHQKMMDQVLEFSLIRGCIEGEKFCDYGKGVQGKPILGHRHDQSILSLLAVRNRCPMHDIHRFGEWRSLAHCMQNGSVLFVHRGFYLDTSGLLWR